MNLDEFESQVKDAIEVGLNRLQTVTLLVVNLEQQLESTRQSMQELTQVIDNFVTAEKQKRDQDQN
ncbi:hypothetical protein H6F90_12220 [Trichocoleus sp. FACHB-591]|uniref:hypothetical protein n=1 Tax=Trichocoleus sp. FACHB-591 TaxID=2692872 RepID=UPI00168800CE|nr:hypothetical protein [Trichocoleus sp. FACHB-591]MBD2095913.1 hypothetical protein [Trichocoleus sp. FACHB-591]